MPWNVIEYDDVDTRDCLGHIVALLFNSYGPSFLRLYWGHTLKVERGGTYLPISPWHAGACIFVSLFFLFTSTGCVRVNVTSLSSSRCGCTLVNQNACLSTMSKSSTCYSFDTWLTLILAHLCNEEEMSFSTRIARENARFTTVAGQRPQAFLRSCNCFIVAIEICSICLWTFNRGQKSAFFCAPHGVAVMVRVWRISSRLGHSPGPFSWVISLSHPLPSRMTEISHKEHLGLQILVR